MSNNPQWKTFQPPIMNSDPAILDYKSMAIPSPKVITGSHQPTANIYRNGTNYSGDHYNMTDSPPGNGKNAIHYASYTNTQTSRNEVTRFPFTTFTGMERTSGYTEEPATNNSTYQDQSGNQGTRETGIVEKLLVRVPATIVISALAYATTVISPFPFSILTDLYSAAKDKQGCSFILANLVVI